MKGAGAGLQSSEVPGISDVKVALAANTPLEYGLVRMFEAHSEDVDTQVRVFHTIEEAVTWLTG
ncbi:MAG: hypothetical protein OEO20_17120 [Gemmatimonadota bacterium]|nr:hypothetical protein [Gemmatimonadota bacterium]MDH3368898.1 hypothetical protein [Gemmatimonadota bacterium]MDH3480020.1 hypothetical protein [Gemmatimonadota bacterium]MDH3571723.1 hypothetical protein [Gemmatimonadota bacterium]MDH5549754.1 hypothetical protein [Gemmatimonadota bacterium]